METPFIQIDQSKMNRNIEGMARMAEQAGVSLRPHIKTHKIPEIAALQMKAGASGITVAKTTEAEVMAEHGIKDIFIAYPVVTKEKLDRLRVLNEKSKLIVGVDSLEGALILSDYLKSVNQEMEVRLEVDTGLRRTGVLYDQALTLALEISKLPHLQLTGIYTFRGAILAGKPTVDLEAAGKEEGEAMVQLAESLRENGVPIRDVSVGSTPTASAAAKVKGVTEVRPGTYVFYDRMQAAFGVCALEDCAASVIVTIVSIPSDDLIIIDGGSKTFATDVQPGTDPLQLKGFGHIVNLPEGVFERLSEEHGMISVNTAHSFKVGDQLEIIPNHICPTINLHDYVYLQDEDEQKKTRVLARGKLQ
ncbi:alanine racemase [Shouchella shacheensis]|uniref:alanine racemase n=1 Tax=Shouchella shacheensis TaxID=1649580 RepID=UPI00073FC257|nr:alanine racemase [Shouchella shacheensis]